MKKSYLNKIHSALLENKLNSLKILLEQDEGDSQADSLETSFDMNDDSEESEEESEKEPEEESEEESEEEVVKIDKANAEKLTRDIKKFTRTVNNHLKNPLGDVEDKLSKVLDRASIGKIGESFYYKDSISRFLNEEKYAEDLQNAMEDFQDTIEKATDVVSDIKKGVVVDIEEYASGAIDTFKSFDNLFEKWKIVKAAAINILATSCGEKAESYIQEFEELFHKELYKQFGIEEEAHYISSKKDKVAAGSKSQG